MPRFTLLLLALVLLSSIGCGGSTAPSTTTNEELQNFFEDNPKEKFKSAADDELSPENR